MSKEIFKKRSDAAQGRVPCDLVIKNTEFLDAFSCRWRRGDIGIIDGTIVGLESGLKGARVIDAKGKSLVPGFIDAHVHVESSMMLPPDFERAVLGRGTTTAVCDPHELANVIGVGGLEYFLASSEKMNLDLRVMLSSCVPATHLETNGGGEIPASDLISLRSHPKALGLAEVMNVPGVINGDPGVIEKLEAFHDGIMDGHAPMLRGKELSAYASTGISSCHESTELEEAREKLTKGISVWIREGSVAKDLEALIPLLDLGSSTSIGFCTDDRNPLDIAEEGHIDHLVRSAIRKGVATEVAYRSASYSVARHYALDRGLQRRGAIAPGYQADLVLLGDRETCAVESVWKNGILTTELNSPERAEASIENTVRASPLDPKTLEGPKGQVNCIGVEHGKIVTSHEVLPSDAPGVARLSVLERYGKGSPPANAYVKGFGEKLNGAIASSVGHDSHNLIVVGSNPKDMAVALSALIDCGGGFSVVGGGSPKATLALPFGGLMCDRSPDDLKEKLIELKSASRAIGCMLPEPFLQLAFLSLPVIPSLKLTDQGLVDVTQFKFISVAA